MYLFLTCLFVTALILANLVGGKLFTGQVGPLPVVLSSGIWIFPITFLLTDVIHDRFGSAAVKQTSLMGLILLVITYGLLAGVGFLPTHPNSPVSDQAYQQVFGASLAVFVASLAAYGASQWSDIAIFRLCQRYRQPLWVRATGSTVLSQSLDTGVFVALAFGATVPVSALWMIFFSNYVWKCVLAVGLTPLCYWLRGTFGGTSGGSSVDSATTDLLKAS
jgi:uncharacterized integral membrane protein (TIGR00697 family)